MIRESAHSAETMREIDLEVKRLVDEAYRCAYDILTTQRKTLDEITRVLFDEEIMSAEQMHAIIDEHRDGPQIMAGTSVAITDQSSATTTAVKPDTKASATVIEPEDADNSSSSEEAS